jgi:hypothetical protein
MGVTPIEAVIAALYGSKHGGAHDDVCADAFLRHLPEGAALVTVESLSAAIRAHRLAATGVMPVNRRHACLPNCAAALIEAVRRG